MTLTAIGGLLLTLSILSPHPQDAKTTPTRVTPHSALAPLEWLAGGRWVASSDDPAAPNLMRESFYEWAPNGQVLRFWSYTTNRQLLRRPYVEGWYVFHPGRKQVIFGYADGGGYYAGEVRQQGDVLEHDFEGVSTSGAVRKYRYTFTRVHTDEMIVRIFDDAPAGWRQVVELVYRRQAF